MRLPLLALLAKEPAHGYELKSLLEEIFGEAYPPPNVGQIYVTLQRLERDGLVRSQDVVQTTRPEQAGLRAHPGRPGRPSEWIDAPSEGPRIRDDFFMKLALGSLAGITDRMDLINRQRRHYLRLMRSLSRLTSNTGPVTTGSRAC